MKIPHLSVSQFYEIIKSNLSTGLGAWRDYLIFDPTLKSFETINYPSLLSKIESNHTTLLSTNNTCLPFFSDLFLKLDDSQMAQIFKYQDVYELSQIYLVNQLDIDRDNKNIFIHKIIDLFDKGHYSFENRVDQMFFIMLFNQASVIKKPQEQQGVMALLEYIHDKRDSLPEKLVKEVYAITLDNVVINQKRLVPKYQKIKEHILEQDLSEFYGNYHSLKSHFNSCVVEELRLHRQTWNLENYINDKINISILEKVIPVMVSFLETKFMHDSNIDSIQYEIQKGIFVNHLLFKEKSNEVDYCSHFITNLLKDMDWLKELDTNKSLNDIWNKGRLKYELEQSLERKDIKTNKMKI